MTKVFDKTEKGREEIATRKYHLSPRARSLLVMIDGKQTADDLLKKVAGLGLTEQCMADLLKDGYIREASPASTVAAVSTVSAASSTAAPAPSAPLHNIAASPDTRTGNRAIALAPSPTPSDAVLSDGQTQYEAIYRFYNETIKSTIGLRGYALKLKVERAATIEDFRQLKKPYLEAVVKAQGQEMARSLRDRLDKLLYLGEPIPESATIAGLHN